MSTEKDSWNEWAKYVLAEIKSLRGNSVELSRELKQIESRIQEKLTNVQLDVHGLKVKMILLGVGIGALTSIIIDLFVRKIFG